LLGATVVAAVSGLTMEALPLASYPAFAGPTMPSAGPASFADVVDRVKGAVVSIKVNTDQSKDSLDGDTLPMPNLPKGSPLEKFFRQFGERGSSEPFDGENRGRLRTEVAQGSGFFVSADGYVVTNNHVVEHATEVAITTADGKTLLAEIVGTDPKTDLALLKVKEGSNYPFVSFASDAPCTVDGAGNTGVVVSDVDPVSAAAEKGIQTGDVILEVAGKTVSQPSEVAAAIEAAKADGKKSVLMRVKSEDAMRYVALSIKAVS
jgi:S1-C subfamily serine protease